MNSLCIRLGHPCVRKGANRMEYCLSPEAAVDSLRTRGLSHEKACDTIKDVLRVLRGYARPENEWHEPIEVFNVLSIQVGELVKIERKQIQYDQFSFKPSVSVRLNVINFPRSIANVRS